MTTADAAARRGRRSAQSEPPTGPRRHRSTWAWVTDLLTILGEGGFGILGDFFFSVSDEAQSAQGDELNGYSGRLSP